MDNRTPEQDDPRGSLVVPVGPLNQASRGRLARLVLGGVAIGAIAFVVGLQFGIAQTAPAALASAGPTLLASAAPAPIQSSPPVAESSPTAPVASGTPAVPGQSAFAKTFDPAKAFADLAPGVGCLSHANEVTIDESPTPGGTFVEVWTIFCPLDVNHRASLLDTFSDRLGGLVPALRYGGTTTVDGSRAFLYPYSTDQFVGEVTMAADAAGPGLEVVVTVTERLAP